MPVTPFHFGPGLLFKAIGPRVFSFTAFVGTQVLIDCETAFYLLTRQYPLHRFFHSLIGATLAGCLVAGAIVIVRDRLPLRIDRWGILLKDDLRTASVFVGAIVGGLSHSVLDNVMHSDVRPFYPAEWPVGLDGQSTGLYRVVDVTDLHIGCLASMLVGVGTLLWRLNTVTGALGKR